MQMYFQTVGPWAFRELVVGERKRKALLRFFYYLQVPGAWMALQVPTTKGCPDGGCGTGCFALPTQSPAPGPTSGLYCSSLVFYRWL